MAKTRVAVAGLQALGARFRALNVDIQGKTGFGAVLAGANVIKKAAIAKAPVSTKTSEIDGEKVPPGTLKKNIVNKRIGSAKSGITAQYAVTVRGKRKNKFASRYGAIEEFGSVDQSPQPYMRPAFDANKQAASDKIVEILKKRIEKAEAGQ